MNIPSELEIRLIGDQVLSEKTKPVEKTDEDIISFGHSLIKMMIEYDGLGLSANQVGVPLSMIALGIPNSALEKNPENISPGEKLLISMMPLVLVNPKIINSSQETDIREEGCISIPGIYADVERPSKIFLEAILNFQNKIKIECGGLLARALQHEIDHLNGVFFVNRLNKKQYLKIKSKLEKLKAEAKKNNYIRKKNDKTC